MTRLLLLLALVTLSACTPEPGTVVVTCPAMRRGGLLRDVRDSTPERIDTVRYVTGWAYDRTSLSLSTARGARYFDIRCVPHDITPKL